MKIKLPIIIALMLCFASCKPTETPESVADKVLTEISNELLSGEPCSTKDFSLALVYNDLAKAFINGEDFPNSPFDKHFQLDKPFSRWKLIDVKEHSIDLYRIWDFTVKGGDIEHDAILDIYKSEGGEFNGEKLCKITETAAAILKHKDIPMYLLRYKMDSRHVAFVGDEYSIATVGVIKHPEDGYRIVSFMWDE